MCPLTQVQARLETLWKLKLKATEDAAGTVGLPRIIRFARRLKLTENETRIIVYILCCQVGESARGGFGRMGRFASGGILYGNDTLSICRACDAKIGDMVDFLNPEREHMKQGIFPDVQQSYILHSMLGFDEVSCKAFVGAPLKENEFLKVEQTPLADVIAEEPGNEHLRSHHEGPFHSPAPETKGAAPAELLTPTQPGAPDAMMLLEV